MSENSGALYEILNEMKNLSPPAMVHQVRTGPGSLYLQLIRLKYTYKNLTRNSGSERQK